MDYQIYMGSSVMVSLPWLLLLDLCSYKLDGYVTTSILHSLLTLVLCHLLTPCLSIEQDEGLVNTWLIDSGCSRHKTGNSKWFSSLDPMQHKEYITFGDNSKVRWSPMVPFGSMGVLSSTMLLWSLICISICFRFRNSLRTVSKCALRKPIMSS